MKLSPHEIDKLSLSNAGFLSQRRLAQGYRLNIPETIALLTFQVMQFAREGKYSVSQLMQIGREFLGRNQVIPGIEEILEEVQIEATFPDGTKLVTLHNPISNLNGNLELSLKGSFVPVPALDVFTTHIEEGLIPGFIHTLPGNITLNVGRKLSYLKVMNCSDRPIQVGSHYHFIETNKMLCFDRIASYGKRLNMYV
jgi:urease